MKQISFEFHWNKDLHFDNLAVYLYFHIPMDKPPQTNVQIMIVSRPRRHSNVL